MLTTAAFTRLFEGALRGSGPTAAWRPEVLIAVRRIAAEWDADHRRELLRPVLRSAAGEGERAASRLLPPDTRRLVSRAFQRLGAPARCLLWHAEVEAEQLEAPASLLGLAAEDAAVKLERARSLLREGCLDVHRELAPDQECRRYSRLLDVSLRRDDNVLDPDLRDHMTTCRHCAHAVDQLNHRDGRLAALLAEAVLGWGAQAYLDTRPGRAAPETDDPAGAAAEAAPGVIRGGESFADTTTRAAAHPGAGPGPRVRRAASHRSGGAGRPRPVPDDGADTPGAPFPGTASGTAPGRTPGTPPRSGHTGRTDSRTAGGRGRGRTAADPAAGTAGDAESADARATADESGRPRAGATETPTSSGHRGASSGRASGPGSAVPGPAAGSRSAALRALRRARRRRYLALAVLAVGACVLVPLAVWAGPWSDDDSDVPGRPAGKRGSGTEADPGVPPAWVGAADGGPVGTLRGRLRNTASGLCVGLDRREPVAGAEAVLVPCGPSANQQWVYESDGLLRSRAVPDLCLDSHLGYTVALGRCTGASKPGTRNVRYDFTLQGTLVPRWNQDLALTPASGRSDAALVLKPRADTSAAQRWLTDTSADRLRLKTVDWDPADEPTAPVPRAPAPARTPAPATTPPPTPSATRSAGTPARPGWDTCSRADCTWGGHGGWWGRGGWGGRR
ncbi:ricin-type beta-trefoil lectin domain protein [Streptomyces sp. NPDC005551]|uniref:RICIN domain-containing protein n=1 Tax=Streptomyces sp. NPDC005551 TaxID=3364725 RepID=UPI00369DD5A7